MSNTEQPFDLRLSKIKTNWDAVLAVDGDTDELVAARNQVLVLYAECAYRYILGATHDTVLAEDLSQEFALRFMRGDYQKADPDKGRFRNYIRRALRNLVSDYYRRKTEYELSPVLANQLSANPLESQLSALDQQFRASWRKRVLRLSWESLRVSDQHRSSHYYLVLKLRSTHPDEDSMQLAKRVTDELGEEVSADWVRQKLHRARIKFAEFLKEHIRQSLQTPTEQAIHDELSELGLQKYLPSP